VTAENIARKWEISRKDQDEFALRSHQRAIAAHEQGRLKAELVAVKTTVFDASGTPRDITVDRDEGPRPDTTLEGLAKLKPAFDPTGSVTAGNSSPLTDGAAAVVVASGERAKAAGLKPLGFFRAFAVAGVPPEIMGIGPVPAVRKLLAKAGMKIDQIDLFELNEAFAAQSLYCARELGIDPEKLNVNGGAIALGHPLGAKSAGAWSRCASAAAWVLQPSSSAPSQPPDIARAHFRLQTIVRGFPPQTGVRIRFF
jgi:acetyl-CoA acyltransferase